jgi:hypothetical protein
MRSIQATIDSEVRIVVGRWRDVECGSQDIYSRSQMMIWLSLTSTAAGVRASLEVKVGIGIMKKDTSHISILSRC